MNRYRAGIAFGAISAAIAIGLPAANWPSKTGTTVPGVVLEDGSTGVKIGVTGSPLVTSLSSGSACTNCTTNTQAVGDNSTKLSSTAFVQAAVGKVKKQQFTSSGTYTPSAGLVNALLECLGSGGGGAGAAAAATGLSGGGGGGSGSYARALVTAAQVGASQTVTIGAGGAGGATGGNNGSNGNDSSVGTLCVGKAGSGGQQNGTTFGGTGGAGGVTGTGDVSVPGNAGGTGRGGTITTIRGLGGQGAGSYYGGAPTVAENGGGITNGTAAAANTGAGGSGGSVDGSASTAAGGNGGSGLVVITEFTNQ